MMTFSKAGVAAALMAAFAYLPLHANAALFDDDEARKAILELRAKVDAMARDLNSRIDTKADKTSTLSLLNQHDQTMQEIARLRGQVDHRTRLDLFEQGLQPGPVGQVQRADIDLRAQRRDPVALDLRVVVIVVVVQPHHRLAGSGQGLAGMGTDKTGSAGNKNGHQTLCNETPGRRAAGQSCHWPKWTQNHLARRGPGGSGRRRQSRRASHATAAGRQAVATPWCFTAASAHAPAGPGVRH